jgi:Outer membrane protein beta-barrel domain
MNQEDNRLDDLFREKLQHFAPEPSLEVWDRILEAMDRKKAVRRMILYRWISVAAVLLIAMITGVLVINDHPLPPAAKKSLSVAAPEKIPPGETTGHNTGAGKKGTILKAEFTKPVQRKQVTPVRGKMPDNVQATLPERNDFPAIVSVPLAGKTSPELPATALPELVMMIRNDSAYPAKSAYNPDKDRLLALESNRKQDVPGYLPEWRIGVHLSPGYASHTVDYSASYARNMSSGGTPSGTGVGAGVSVQVKTSRRWAVESGLFYSRNGDRSVNSHQIFTDKAEYAYVAVGDIKYFSNAVSLDNGKMTMNSTAGAIRFTQTPDNAKLISSAGSPVGMNSTLLTPGEFFQVFDFMEVPLVARYRLIDSKIALDLLGGFSTNFVVGNQVILESTSSREYVGKTSDIASLGISGSAGFGILYPLSKRICITIEPRASYWLSSLNNSGEVSFRPWKIGVYSGLTFGF